MNCDRLSVWTYTYRNTAPNRCYTATLPEFWAAWVAVGRGLCIGKGIGGLDYRGLLANRISGLIRFYHAHLPT